MGARRDSFQSVIAALWARLDLGQPRLVEPGRVQLRIGAVAVDLLDEGQTMLVIEGSAGNLPSAPAERDEEIRRILRTNLGFLLNGDAGVYTKRLPGDRIAVMVRSTCRYASHSTERLVQQIEDVVNVLEHYTAGLKQYAPPPRQHKRRASRDTEAAVIFKP